MGFNHTFTVEGLVGAYQPHKDVVVLANSLQELRIKLHEKMKDKKFKNLMKKCKKEIPEYLKYANPA